MLGRVTLHLERLIVPGNAAERFARSGLLLIGSGVLVHAGFLLPAVLKQRDLAPVWWTPVALVGVFGTAVVLVAATLRGRAETVRWAAIGYATSYVVAELGWLATWSGGHIRYDESIWISVIPVLGMMVGAVVWPLRLTVFYVAVVCVSSASINFVAREGHGNNQFALEILSLVSFSSIFVIATVAAMRIGIALDATASEAIREAESAAAIEARAAERQRFDALIHDGVLATFLGASRFANNDILVRQAAATLAQFDGLRNGGTGERSVTAVAIAALVRTAIEDVDSRYRFQFESSTGADVLAIPREVGRALTAGVTEAVRNVARHAGSGVSCEVVMSVQPSSIRIDVVDDGIGFDPDAVSPLRFGLRVSIGRMDSVPGGWSAIESAPRSGCRVALGWRE